MSYPMRLRKEAAMPISDQGISHAASRRQAPSYTRLCPECYQPILRGHDDFCADCLAAMRRFGLSPATWRAMDRFEQTYWRGLAAADALLAAVTT